MSGVNKVILVGRLGSDPEVKTIPSGQTVARLSLATSEKWTDKDGKVQERTEWHRIVVWGKQAEMCGKYLEKGRQIYVEGKLQTRSWENNEGQKQYSTEIVSSTVQFLLGGESTKSSRPENSAPQRPNTNRNLNQSTPMNTYDPVPSIDTNDEIPF